MLLYVCLLVQLPPALSMCAEASLDAAAVAEATAVIAVIAMEGAMAAATVAADTATARSADRAETATRMEREERMRMRPVSTHAHTAPEASRRCSAITRRLSYSSLFTVLVRFCVQAVLMRPTSGAVFPLPCRSVAPRRCPAARTTRTSGDPEDRPQEATDSAATDLDLAAEDTEVIAMDRDHSAAIAMVVAPMAATASEAIATAAARTAVIAMEAASAVTVMEAVSVATAMVVVSVVTAMVVARTAAIVARAATEATLAATTVRRTSRL